MARSGALELSRVNARAFRLEEIARAIGEAESLGGLDYALLLPNG